MERLFIKNRKGQKVRVYLEKAADQKGLAFVMHGLGGFAEQAHIKIFAKAFTDKGYTVVRFDATNAYGESDGDYANATTTNYYEDLEDVIEWARMQEFFVEPFCLAGHSLGGICTALYAEKNPEKVKGLAPISTVVSGDLSYNMPDRKEMLAEWERAGWQEIESKTTSGLIKRLKWSHVADRLKYDLLPEVDKLQMPILMIVGDEDTSTPLKHQQILFDAISHEKKELHIIKGAPHTFMEQGHLDEIYKIFSDWIEKYI